MGVDSKYKNKIQHLSSPSEKKNDLDGLLLSGKSKLRYLSKSFLDRIQNTLHLPIDKVLSIFNDKAITLLEKNKQAFVNYVSQSHKDLNKEDIQLLYQLFQTDETSSPYAWTTKHITERKTQKEEKEKQSLAQKSLQDSRSAISSENKSWLRDPNLSEKERLQLSKVGESKVVILSEDIKESNERLVITSVSEEVMGVLESYDTHSLDIKTYAEKRFSKAVLNEVIEGELNIDIFVTNNTVAFRKLKAQGFTHILPYQTMEGAFKRYLVMNPTTKEKRLAVLLRPGKSYRQHVEAILLLYKNENGNSINPDSIAIFEKKTNLESTYSSILSSYQCSPSIVTVGNHSQFHDLLVNHYNVRPSFKINDPFLVADVFHLQDQNGQEKEILCTNITPHLFGDRSKFFTKAVIDSGAKELFFTGTTGALHEQRFKVGDITIPKRVFELQKGTRTLPSLPIENKTLDLLPKRKGSNIKVIEAHGSVKSPAIETKAVLDEMVNEGIDAVDCELSYIIEGIQEKTSDINFYFNLKVSDIPGTEHELSRRKNFLPSLRKVTTQEQISSAFFEKVIGQKYQVTHSVKEDTSKMKMINRDIYECDYEDQDKNKYHITIRFSKGGLPGDLQSYKHGKQTILKSIEKTLYKDTEILLNKQSKIYSDIQHYEELYGIFVTLELKQQLNG